MRKFVAKHAAATTGTLSRFDRLLFKGHLSLGYPHAFNPAAPTDLTLFAAVLRGEHTLQGLRNRHLRVHLFGPDAGADRRRSAHVSRLLKRLHLRGLLAKIPRSRRWRVTQLGHAVMSTAVLLHEEHFPSVFLKDAA